MPESELISTGSTQAPKGSPRWWLARLEAKLDARKRDLALFESYYEGEHKLAFATEQFRKAFGLTFRAFSDNFMQTVVDAVDERLNVEGFRIPQEGADPIRLLEGDSQAWDMWQANQLDSDSQLVHTDALVDGTSYVIIGPGADYPEITGESALQVITESQAGYRGRRLAALKKWQDDDNVAFATLYLKDDVYKWISPGKVSGGAVKWIERRVDNEPWPLRNPIGIVPVVPFCNRPRLISEGRSEIAQLIPLQDGINKLFMDMMIASEYAGFPQRYVAGIEEPEDAETHQKVDTLKMALDRFLSTPNSDAQFGTLQAAELGNYTNAIAMAIQHLATRSSTPPHYFLANMGNFPSGEALKAAETGLVAKVHRRMRGFGESWEEVIRLAFLMDDKPDKATAAMAGEVIWKDPESRTESQHIDAVIKMTALGIPAEMLWAKSGWFSPQEIERMKTMLAEGAPTAPSVIRETISEPGTPKPGEPGAGTTPTPPPTNP